MEQGTGGGWIGSGIVDVTGVSLTELARLVETDPQTQAALRTVVDQVRRGGDGDLIAGFNSSL